MNERRREMSDRWEDKRPEEGPNGYRMPPQLESFNQQVYNSLYQYPPPEVPNYTDVYKPPSGISYD